MLHPDMSAKTEHLLAHSLLESIDESEGDDHHGYTDRRSDRGQPDDEARKRFLFIKRYASRYETRNIQEG